MKPTRDEAMYSFMKFFNVNLYDVFLDVACIAFISRLAVLLLYLTNFNTTPYDMEFTLPEYLSRVCWTCLDLGLFAFWYRAIRPLFLYYMVEPISYYTHSLSLIIGCLLSFITVYLAVIEGKLVLFFMIDKVLVRWTIFVPISLLIYRFCGILDSADEPRMLPALFNDYRQKYTSDKI